MARLCIRVSTNQHPTDSTLNPFRSQLGDVVVIQPDGWVFSPAELNCGQYRVVDVAGVAPSVFHSLLNSVFDAGGIMTARRAFRIEPTIINNAVWKVKFTATKTQIDLVTVTAVY